MNKDCIILLIQCGVIIEDLVRLSITNHHWIYQIMKTLNDDVHREIWSLSLSLKFKIGKRSTLSAEDVKSLYINMSKTSHISRTFFNSTEVEYYLIKAIKQDDVGLAMKLLIFLGDCRLYSHIIKLHPSERMLKASFSPSHKLIKSDKYSLNYIEMIILNENNVKAMEIFSAIHWRTMGLTALCRCRSDEMFSVMFKSGKLSVKSILSFLKGYGCVSYLKREKLVNIISRNKDYNDWVRITIG